MKELKKVNSLKIMIKNAQDKGLLVNATMSKDTILKKLTTPTLRDFNTQKLREIAGQQGVSLRGNMTKEGIIKRLKNPIPHTIESLQRLASNNNIEVGRNITKLELIGLLQDANLITRTPGVVDSNIGVRFIDTSLPMIRKQKRPVSAREELMSYLEKLRNKLKYASKSKTTKLLAELQRKMENAKEEHNRLFEAKETNSALRGFTKTYTINGIDGYDGDSFFNSAEDSITKVLRENRQTKVKLIFKCNMEKEKDEEVIIRPFNFHSNIEVNHDGTDENELYEIMIDTIKGKIDKLQYSADSGWRLHSIIKLELHTVQWVPLRGSSYIELPKYLKNKNAIINMKNDDDKCLLWCVLRAINRVKKNNDRIDGTLKSKMETLNTTAIKYPVSLADIKKFEYLNSNISISILGYNEKDKVYPLRVSDYIDREHDIVLMLICDGERKHYCLVNNLSRLLGLQTSSHGKKR